MSVLEIIGVTSLIITIATAGILFWQVSEVRKATYGSSFSTVYNILQDQEIREARGLVLGVLRNKKVEKWSSQEIKIAEMVCQSYDSVGIMVRNRMIKESIVADSWGDSVRKCWQILSPFVYSRRAKFNSNEFWDDFQYLATCSEKYQLKVHSNSITT